MWGRGVVGAESSFEVFKLSNKSIQEVQIKLWDFAFKLRSVEVECTAKFVRGILSPKKNIFLLHHVILQSTVSL